MLLGFQPMRTWGMLSSLPLPIATEPRCRFVYAKSMHIWPRLNLIDPSNSCLEKNASPTTLGRVPNAQIRTLSEFQGFCFCFPEWVLFAQLERSVSRHILFIRLKKGDYCPKSYTMLFCFIWGKMVYARAGELKTQSYCSSHRRPPSFLHQQWWKDVVSQANRKKKLSPTLGMCLRSWFMFHAESYSCSSS